MIVIKKTPLPPPLGRGCLGCSLISAFLTPQHFGDFYEPDDPTAPYLSQPSPIHPLLSKVPLPGGREEGSYVYDLSFMWLVHFQTPPRNKYNASVLNRLM